MTDKTKKIKRGKTALDKMGATDKDLTTFQDEMPANKGTIEKNIALIRHIKENCEENIPEGYKDEMYDTIMGMTERKMLDASNVFTYVVASELQENLDRLCDSVVAMHGIVIQLLTRVGTELDNELSDNQKGILNVLHLGKTSETLPTKKELLEEVKEFNDATVEEQRGLPLGNALFPRLIQKTQKDIHDILGQLTSAGIYASATGEKVVMGAIRGGILERLFLPSKDGQGAYAVRVSEGVKKPSIPSSEDIGEMIDELMDKLGDSSEIKAKISKIMNDLDKQDKKEKN